MTIRAACFAVRRVFRPFVRDERGVILALVSVMIAVLLGLAGLAFEPGLWYMFRRYDQSAADVAALSGALEKAAGKSDADICTLARSAARLNGFTDPGSCGTGLAPGAGVLKLESGRLFPVLTQARRTLLRSFLAGSRTPFWRKPLHRH